MPFVYMCLAAFCLVLGMRMAEIESILSFVGPWFMLFLAFGYAHLTMVRLRRRTRVTSAAVKE